MAAALQRRFWIWCAAMAALLAVFAGSVVPNLHLESDILALMPAEQREPGSEAAVARFSDTLGQRLLFLVGARDRAESTAAAEVLAARLQDSGVFAEVRLHVDTDWQSSLALYREHRGLLLSDRHRRWLQAGDHERLQREALAVLYTPAGLARVTGVAEDPLGLLDDFVQQQWPPRGAARLRDGMLTLEHAGTHYVLVSVQAHGDPFAMAALARAGPVIESTLAELRSRPGVEVHGAGVMRHAWAAASRARAEMTVIGTLALGAVAGLLLFVFRGVRPLLLGTGALALGAVAGLTVTHLLFGQVHVLTLVFGCSLIGVSVDYTFHFLADRFRDDAPWHADTAPAHVGPAILVGLVTTVLGYLCLAAAPIPGLRQMAVFSAAGLVVACACVMCAFPLLARDGPRPAAAHRVVAAMRAFARRRWPVSVNAGLLLLLAVFTLAGLAQLRFTDDIRLLQRSPPQLMSDEAHVRQLLGNHPDSRFYLVRGPDAETLLQREEALRRALDGLVADGALSAYQAVSRALPSLHTQSTNRALLQALQAPDGLLARWRAELGLDPAPDGSAVDRPLHPEEWLASPASTAYRHLWLGRIAQEFASVVTLLDVRDVAALAAAAQPLPGTRFVDRVAEASAALEHYRVTAMQLLALVYSAVGVLLAARYGPGTAVRLLAAPLGASLLTLAMFGWLGMSANVFVIMATLLVLGMGIDYGVFLHEGARRPIGATLAVALSALTTLTAFGLLGLSATPFLRDLGLTLLMGIALAFTLALRLSRAPLTD